MPTLAQFREDQYPATDEMQCLQVYIPEGDEFKWLLAGLMRLPTLATSYNDPESEQALGLADIWRDAVDMTDWGGCVVANSEQGRTQLWHRFSIVTTGNAINLVMDASQMFGHIVRQNTPASGDDFYQLAWFTAGNYGINVLAQKTTDSGQFRVIAQHQGSMAQTTMLGTVDFGGGFTANHVVSGTFTLTESGLYKVFGQCPGKSAGSSFFVRLTMMDIWRIS